MQSLGFQYSTEQRHPHGTSWHGPFDLQINLPDSHELTLLEASSLVIHSAMVTGKNDTQKAIKKLLAV